MGKRHPVELRGAVMAALLSGQSVSEIARQYKLPIQTVSGWKRTAQGFPDYAEIKREIADLTLEYLRANMRSLRAQVEVFADPVYLREQGASENAVLHGVQADKAFRILEAAEAAGHLDGEDADVAPETTGDS